MAQDNKDAIRDYIGIVDDVKTKCKEFSTVRNADVEALLKGYDAKNITLSQWNAAISQLGYTAEDVRRMYPMVDKIVDAVNAAFLNLDEIPKTYANTAEANAKAYADSSSAIALNAAKDYADSVGNDVLGTDASEAFDMTVYGNRRFIEQNAARIAEMHSPDVVADLVITTEEDFDQCLYPLYKNEETLTREQAARIVDNDNAFNTPDPNFKAKRILVKGITFTKTRGYDDVRLHVFHPSIEYIKFDNCRWEAHWKVSGKNPRDTSAMNCNLNTSPERATAFNRATDPLTLTIEGLHITEDNTSAARVSDQWGVGLRNIKVLKNCYIDYPKGYKLTSGGYAALEMSCQFFDFADNCSISGLWDGANVVNCKVSKILKKCANIANLEAVNLLYQSGNIAPLKILSCVNMANVKGTVAFEDDSTPTCEGNVAVTRKEAQGYADTAKDTAKAYTDGKIATRRELLSGDDLKVGECFVYSVNKDIDSATGAATIKQYRVHARTSAGAGEIPLRTPYGTLLSPQEWSSTNFDYSNTKKWTSDTLMPRNYIDTWFPKLDDSKKIPAANLPSYVDDVLEYTVKADFPPIGESGKIYIDTTTRKTYRWSGSKYVEISQSLALGETSSTAFPGDKGATAYAHSQQVGNPHNTHPRDIGAYNTGEVDDLIAEHAGNVNNPHQVTAAQVGAVALQTASAGQRCIYATGWGNNVTTPLSLDTGSGGAGKIPSYWAPDAATSLPDSVLITGTPTKDWHAANKAYVDTVSTALPDDIKSDARALRSYLLGGDGSVVSSTVYVESTAGTPAASAVPLRDSSKQLHVPTTPTAATHAASKSYVDTLGLGAPAYGTATNIYGMFAIPNRSTTAQYIPAAEGVPSFDFPSVVLRSPDGRLYCKTDDAIINNYEIVNKKFLKSHVGDFISESFLIPAHMWDKVYEINSPYYHVYGYLQMYMPEHPVLATVRYSVHLTICPTSGMTSCSARVPTLLTSVGYAYDLVFTATVNSVTSNSVNVKFQVFKVDKDNAVTELDYSKSEVSFSGCVSQVNFLGV